METANRSVLTVNLEARMRLFARHYISLKGAYGIQNENFFKMFTESRNLFGIGLKYAYNSPIGPISILFDVSNIDKSLGVYFSLGKPSDGSRLRPLTRIKDLHLRVQDICRTFGRRG